MPEEIRRKVNGFLLSQTRLCLSGCLAMEGLVGHKYAASKTPATRQGRILAMLTNQKLIYNLLSLHIIYQTKASAHVKLLKLYYTSSSISLNRRSLCNPKRPWAQIDGTRVSSLSRYVLTHGASRTFVLPLKFRDPVEGCGNLTKEEAVASTRLNGRVGTNPLTLATRKSSLVYALHSVYNRPWN